ncbi:putative cytochrome P450 [Septoria linicola]|nr:putative cytochrome P450 [Septoria linicola]
MISFSSAASASDISSIALQSFAGAIVLGIVYYLITGGQQPVAGIPIIGLDRKDKKSWPWQSEPAPFVLHANELLERGKEVSRGIFQVKAGAGYKVILPNRFAHELRNNPDLSFAAAGQKDFHANYPGFEGFREGLRPDGLMGTCLAIVTADIIEEADYAVKLWLGDISDWTTVYPKQGLLDVIARASGRIFGGKDLSRDKEWIELSKAYTVAVFAASNDLHKWHPLLQPLAQFTESSCKIAREQVAAARRVVAPQVDRRLKARDAALAEGASSKSIPDVFSWLVEMGKGRKINFAEGQLNLSMVALHTTTEMATRCLLALCEHPEIVQPLRDEINEVLGQDGWAKTAFHKMKLLDSFLKECQRHRQMATMSMMRVTTKPITLSDGTKIPRGAYIQVCDDATEDPDIYPEPEKFDAWRYLKMRQRPGHENLHQFVSTSPDNLGFGHGQHACPGRFFASTEIKIIISSLLLQFDWRFGPGQKSLPDLQYEHNFTIDPETALQCRKRVPEIDVVG